MFPAKGQHIPAAIPFADRFAVTAIILFGACDDFQLKENEKEWLAFLRLIDNGSDPGVALRQLRLL